jgi:hypothetical protein
MTGTPFALLLACAISASAAAETLQPDAPLSGEVLEVLDVGAYTYLRLKTSGGEQWAAVNRAPLQKGANVTIFDPAEMRDFESRALGRTFSSIFFGTVAGAVLSSSPAPHPGVASSRAGRGAVHGEVANSAGSASDFKISKAAGVDARTVAEIHFDRVSLKDKPIELRAKVAKVTLDVMGRNWLHLRDGSGSAADGSNDILVATRRAPNVGDVIVVSGVVRTDVSLGPGHDVEVLVEDASAGM